MVAVLNMIWKKLCLFFILSMNYVVECQKEIISLADLNERVRDATESNVIIIILRDSRSEEDNFFSDNSLRQSGANLPKKRMLPKHVYNLYYTEVDKSGNEVYKRWLYNLRDVVLLLRERFNIAIH